MHQPCRGNKGTLMKLEGEKSLGYFMFLHIMVHEQPTFSTPGLTSAHVFGPPQ